MIESVIVVFPLCLHFFSLFLVERGVFVRACGKCLEVCALSIINVGHENKFTGTFFFLLSMC